MPDRSEVLDVLNLYVPTAKTNPERSNMLLNRLKTLGDGTSYRYMYRELFPRLRNSRLYVMFQRTPQPLAPDTVEYVAEIIEVEEPLPSVEPAVADTLGQRKPFYMALKTNMLYDVLALPSIGAEFYLGRNWSIGANWLYGWWHNDSRHRYWRAYGGDIVVRKWFGTKAHAKPLTGHHLGIYAGAQTFDFEWGGTGYMGGIPGGTLWDRAMFNAGIEYGFSVPVDRRLNIDFTLGVGYFTGKLEKYVPADNCYVWQSTSRIRWIGPTKAEISLVWLIGRGNYNRKKGETL